MGVQILLPGARRVRVGGAIGDVVQEFPPDASGARRLLVRFPGEQAIDGLEGCTLLVEAEDAEEVA